MDEVLRERIMSIVPVGRGGAAERERMIELRIPGSNVRFDVVLPVPLGRRGGALDPTGGRGSGEPGEGARGSEATTDHRPRAPRASPAEAAWMPLVTC